MPSTHTHTKTVFGFVPCSSNCWFVHTTRHEQTIFKHDCACIQSLFWQPAKERTDDLANGLASHWVPGYLTGIGFFCIFLFLLIILCTKCNNNNFYLFIFSCFSLRSLPKLSSQDEEGGAGHGYGGGPQHFEPIPHDHDFCERVVINVSTIIILYYISLHYIIMIAIINHSRLLVLKA